MRQAHSGHYGYSPYGSQAAGGDRIANLKRAIDSIEQKLNASVGPVGTPMGAAVGGSPYQQPGFGHSQTPMAPQQPSSMMHQPQGADLGLLQDQINRLSGQIGMGGVSAQPNFNPVQDINAAAAEIVRRQQALNNGAAAMPPVPAPATLQNQSILPDIAAHLAELKSELHGLRSEVAKPEVIKQEVTQGEIDRIANAVADLQKGQGFDEEAFTHLTSELDSLRGNMAQEVGVSIREELEKSRTADSQSIDERMAALTQSLQDIANHSQQDMTPRVAHLAGQLNDLKMTVEDLPQTLSISRLDDRFNELANKLEMLIADEQEPVASMSSDDFSSIEGRLDEISRALVAVSNMGKKAPSVDMSSVERIEARMSEFGQAIDQLAQHDSKSEFEQLAIRIDGLTDRLGSFEKYAEAGDLGAANAMFAAPDTGVIEDQLRMLNERVEQAAAHSQTQQLEEQIRLLSSRVEEAANINSTAAQMSNLEAQIGQIIRHMSKLDAPSIAEVDFSPLESRLGQIETQLVSNQNFSLEAAQQAAQEAAQQAISLMGPQSDSAQIMQALSEDLKALQVASENGSAQNYHSVQEVQQTLAQVVNRLGSIESSFDNRLGSLEHSIVDVVRAPVAQTAMPAAANLAAPMDIPTHNQAIQRSADETAFAADGLADAAYADQQSGVLHNSAAETGYVEPPFGAQGTAPLTTPNIQVDAPALDPTDHIERSMMQSAPQAAENNIPLEPGSQAPDLDRLVQEAAAKLNADKANMAAPAMGMPVNAVPEVNTPVVDEVQPNAIEAARRALKHTQEEINAVKDGSIEKDGGSKLSGLKDKLAALKSSVASPKKDQPAKEGGSKFDFDKFRKPVVLAVALALLAFVGVKGYQMVSGGDPKPMAKIDAPAKSSKKTPEKAAEKKIVSEAGETVKQSVVATNDAAENLADTTVAKARSVDPVQSVEVPVAAEATVKENTVGETLSKTEVETSPVTPTAKTVSAPVKEDTVTEEIQTVEETAKPAIEVPSSAGSAALVAAASGGDPKALFQIGMRYSDGGDLKRDMAQSAKWFELSAEKGFAPAQYSIGSLYEKGIGVKRDIMKAGEWYAKAADQGNARAMHNLAVIRAMGNPPEVQPDMDTAVGWFKKAANYGIKDSQFNLGILYGQGMGVPQNLSESYKWFALAAKTGDADAANKRDEVANAMEPEDLDVSRKEVAAWKPEKLVDSVNRVPVPAEWKGKGTAERKSVSASGTVSMVKKAQAVLNQRGFDVGTPDGLMGPKTTKAIMEFQRSAGIPVTGKVDNKLLKALDLNV